MLKKLILGTTLYLLCCFSVVASEDRGFFWQVDSAQARVYLFGSIHFADESFYPLRAEVEQAFDASDMLVVEVDINSAESAQRFQQLIQAEGYYAEGKSLQDDLSAETYNKLRAYLKAIGVPWSMVKKQKPGVVVLTLAALQAKQVGLKPELGIDVHFLSAAQKRKKINSLETMDQQLRLFLDIEDADLLLRDSLYSLDLLEEQASVLIAAWKQGDDEVMSRLLFEDALEQSPALVRLYKSLYFQRNLNMSEKIKDFLGRKGTYFVVVGTGHLIGDRGIVRLLQQAGYRVSRQ